jgi:cytochrome c-type biogenesis protein CcmH/NrfF
MTKVEPASTSVSTGEPSLAAEQIAQSLSHELMSPYCPGRTLSSCPSPNARKLEAFILEEASNGKSKEQIEQELVASFGREKLGTLTSPAIIGFAGGLGLVAAMLIAVLSRRWRRGGTDVGAEAAVWHPHDPRTPSSSGSPSDDELDRLSDALDEIEEF